MVVISHLLQPVYECVAVRSDAQKYTQSHKDTHLPKHINSFIYLNTILTYYHLLFIDFFFLTTWNVEQT